MKTIYKYKIDVGSYFYLDLPVGSETLSVHGIGDDAYMWIMIDRMELEQEKKVFYIAKTGEYIDGLQYKRFIGTFIVNEGEFVGHVFELI